MPQVTKLMIITLTQITRLEFMSGAQFGGHPHVQHHQQPQPQQHSHLEKAISKPPLTTASTFAVIDNEWMVVDTLLCAVCVAACREKLFPYHLLL